MAARSGRHERSRKPTLIFTGTIKKLKAATLKGVRADPRTAIVTVANVVESSRELSMLAGHDVTVQLSGRVRPAVGQTLTFYTFPVMFGDSIVTQSIKEESAPATRAAALAPGDDPVARKASRDVQDRFNHADVVVSGRVAAVKLPDEAAPRRRAAKATPAVGPRRPISEHDPKWRDAIVEVDGVHKGSRIQPTVTVRFPASTDVRWYRAPKFQPGQQGYFLLHKTKAAHVAAAPKGRAARAKGAAPAGRDVFTALHPADFQPYQQADALRATIGAAAAKNAPNA